MQRNVIKLTCMIASVLFFGFGISYGIDSYSKLAVHDFYAKHIQPEQTASYIEDFEHSVQQRDLGISQYLGSHRSSLSYKKKEILTYLQDYIRERLYKDGCGAFDLQVPLDDLSYISNCFAYYNNDQGSVLVAIGPFSTAGISLTEETSRPIFVFNRYFARSNDALYVNSYRQALVSHGAPLVGDHLQLVVTPRIDISSLKLIEKTDFVFSDALGIIYYYDIDNNTLLPIPGATLENSQIYRDPFGIFIVTDTNIYALRKYPFTEVAGYKLFLVKAGDANSFQYMGHGIARDNNIVFTLKSTFDETGKYRIDSPLVIEGVNAASLRVFEQDYMTDSNALYYKGNRFSTVDTTTWKPIKNSEYSYDNNYLYLGTMKDSVNTDLISIQLSELGLSGTLSVFEDTCITDKQKVIIIDRETKDAHEVALGDQHSICSLYSATAPSYYSMNDGILFYNGKEVSRDNSSPVRNIEAKNEYAWDSSHIYYQGKSIYDYSPSENATPLESLGYNFYKNDVVVIWNNKATSFDPQTFEHLYGLIFKDKYGVYHYSSEGEVPYEKYLDLDPTTYWDRSTLVLHSSTEASDAYHWYERNDEGALWEIVSE